MQIGDTLEFLTGKYIVLAFDEDSTGTYLAILLDTHKREFVICNFRKRWDEWGMGQYADTLRAALALYDGRVLDRSSISIRRN
jgi:hypothetical protein